MTQAQVPVVYENRFGTKVYPFKLFSEETEAEGGRCLPSNKVDDIFPIMEVPTKAVVTCCTAFVVPKLCHTIIAALSGDQQVTTYNVTTGTSASGVLPVRGAHLVTTPEQTVLCISQQDGRDRNGNCKLIELEYIGGAAGTLATPFLVRRIVPGIDVAPYTILDMAGAVVGMAGFTNIQLHQWPDMRLLWTHTIPNHSVHLAYFDTFRLFSNGRQFLYGSMNGVDCRTPCLEEDDTFSKLPIFRCGRGEFMQEAVEFPSNSGILVIASSNCPDQADDSPCPELTLTCVGRKPRYKNWNVLPSGVPTNKQMYGRLATGASMLMCVSNRAIHVFVQMSALRATWIAAVAVFASAAEF